MENNKSFWLDTTQRKKYSELKENIECDVCVIGGGITGISCAYYLSKNNLSTVVLEKDKIASKTTGHTTAKITSQHDLFYDYLIMSKGEEFAKKYYEANEKAINNIENIIKKENIECNFKRVDSYVYTKDINLVQDIKKEVDAVKSIGGNCSFVEELNIPIKIKGAIRFPNQAEFNPIEYINGLCEAIEKNNGKIYEKSRVIEYKKDDDIFKVLVETEKANYIVKCKYLVVATRYPIFNVPGYHFIKMYQEISYGIATKMSENIPIKDMYISKEKPVISIRNAKYNDENYLLVIGNNHKTGEEVCTRERYEILTEVAKNIVGDCNIDYYWNTEDCIGLDKIAYIGKYSDLIDNMYVATGFRKWGMTTSNIAANIITDLISGKENEYLETYDSTRLEPIKNIKEVQNMMMEIAKSIVAPRLDVTREKKYCTHLGCELTWNELTKTWDCPCHGSRFEENGKSIEGPSVKDMDN